MWNDRGLFGNEEDLTLKIVEARLPFICPRNRPFQVLLQYFMIFLAPNRTVKQIIVSKVSDGRDYIVFYIINVK